MTLNYYFFFFYRPAAKHLDTALSALKQAISDPAECVAQAESQLSSLMGSTNVTPSAIARFGSGVRRDSGSFTPTSGGSIEKKTPASSRNALANRARQLEQYGTPPPLSPFPIAVTPLVRQNFKPPARRPPPV